MFLKIAIYSVLVFVLGLVFAFRISSVSNQKQSLRTFGPRESQGVPPWDSDSRSFEIEPQIDEVFEVKQEPKVTEKYQVVDLGSIKLFTDFFPQVHTGDRIKVKGKVNENGLVFNANVEKIGSKGGFGAFFSQIKADFSGRIDRLLPSREATLVKGAILGVDDIDSGFRDALIKTGTIHVVVVSGQNLAIAAGVFTSLALYLGRRLSLVLALIFCLVYALIAGFEPPVMRALLMVSVSTLGVYLGRPVIAIWSLILAALVIIFIWPASISEISFQLTFAASLGIMTLGKTLESKFKRLPIIGQNLAVATSAYVFTMPIIFYYFGRVSLIAPIANLFVIEAVFPIMVLGFAALVLTFILWPLAQVGGILAYVPAFYFAKCVELFANVPFGYVEAGSIGIFGVIASYFLIFLSIYLWGQKTKS